MLELKGIKKAYKLDGQEFQALKGIDLKFDRNEFVSILGPSGCGKTTMLNIIGGLDKYSAGDLLINGRSTKSLKMVTEITIEIKKLALCFRVTILSITYQ